MSSLGTLVPERPRNVFHTHTHKDTQHTLRPNMYINTTSQVLTAAICIALNNSLISKNNFPQCIFF